MNRLSIQPLVWVSLLLAHAWPGAAATEFGVMWHAPGGHGSPHAWARTLATNGADWVRVVRGWPLPGERHAMQWWPGATPAGDRGLGGGTRWRLATDLRQVFLAARTAAQAPAAGVVAWEIGNEPDLDFTADLPDRMAATLKAAWWGAKSVRPRLKIVMPGLASRPGPNAELLAENGVVPFTDAWNFHYYGWAQDFTAAVEAQRAFARRHGGGHLPLWLTEYGFAEFDAHNRDLWETQLARQGAFFERTTVEARFAGVAQAWAFCLHPQVEGGLDFGLLEADQRPRPALTGWLETVRRLRLAEPRYRLRQKTDGELVGLVCAEPAPGNQGERWWTVLFTPNRRADFALPLRAGVRLKAQPRAAPATSHHEFRLSFPDGIGPVSVGLSGEHGLWTQRQLPFMASAATNLHLTTAPRRFTVEGCSWEAIRETTVPLAPPAAPSPVVITVRPVGPAVSADHSAVAYRYGPALPVELEVTLHNFSSVVQSGTWRLELPNGWTGKPGIQSSHQIVLSPESDWRTNLLFWPSGAEMSHHQLLRARWRNRSGIEDRTVVRLAPATGLVGEAHGLGTGWHSLDQASGWRREESPEGMLLHLERQEPGTHPGLIFPLPGKVALRADDRLRFRMRWSVGREPGRCRIELVTTDREVFRQGKESEHGPAWQTMEFRVGDFTPGFWSRVAAGDPTRAAYVRLTLLGLVPGGSVEFTPLEWLR